MAFWGVFKRTSDYIYQTIVESRGKDADICNVQCPLKPVGDRCKALNITMFGDCFPSCEGFECQSSEVLCSHCLFKTRVSTLRELEGRWIKSCMYTLVRGWG